MRTLFLSIGSNIEPEKNLPEAVLLLSKLVDLIRISNAYRTEAVGPVGQPDFVNAAVLCSTQLQPAALRLELRHIESTLGRVRTRNKFGPRTVDLDIVLFGERIINDHELTIPDPQLIERGYLAMIVSELDPAFRHPITDESLGSISTGMGGADILAVDDETSAALRSAASLENPA